MSTQLSRWNPFKELDELQNRLAASFGLTPPRGGEREALTVSDWTPRVDITEDEKEFLIKAELPEVKKEDVKITVEDGVLAFSGERKAEKEEKTKKVHRVEREYGSFYRSFTLPAGTTAEKVSADYKDGLLKIHLAKDGKAAGAKTVEVKAA